MCIVVDKEDVKIARRRAHAFGRRMNDACDLPPNKTAGRGAVFIRYSIRICTDRLISVVKLLCGLLSWRW